MTPPSAVHSTFTIERSFSAPVTRVFAAWADAAKKRRWSSCHEDWGTVQHSLDFRVDGTELSRAVAPDGTVLTVRARFLDIVPEQRIVYAYDLLVGDVRTSVSLVTVTFTAGASATKMTFTEQVVFLDGHGDLEERIEGTEAGLGRMDAEVGTAPAVGIA